MIKSVISGIVSVSEVPELLKANQLSKLLYSYSWFQLKASLRKYKLNKMKAFKCIRRLSKNTEKYVKFIPLKCFKMIPWNGDDISVGRGVDEKEVLPHLYKNVY